MEFPLARRELTQAAKARRTFVYRTIPAGAATLIVLPLWAIREMTMSAFRGKGGTTSGAEVLGDCLAIVALCVEVAAAFLFAPMLASGMVSVEKRERTLGLLLMADLSGRDIYLAKFASAFLQAELLLLSMAPFMAFAGIFGGVSIPNASLQLVLLTLCTAATVSLGLLFSTAAPSPARAFFYVVSFLMLWIVGTALADGAASRYLGTGLNLNLLTVLRALHDLSPTPGVIVPQAVIATAIAMGASALAVVLLPRKAYDDGGRLRASTPQRGIRREIWRARPAARIIASSGTGFVTGSRTGSFRYLAFLALAAITVVPCAGYWLVVALLCYDIATSLEAARRDGAFDELLPTPVENRVIARGVVAANLRIAAFYGGAVVAGSVGAWGLSWAFGGPFGASWRMAPYGFTPAVTIALSALGVASTAAFLAATAAVGSYVSVQRGTAARHALVSFATVAFTGFAVLTALNVATSLAVAGMGGPGSSWASSAALLMAGIPYAVQILVFSGVCYGFYRLLVDGVRRLLTQMPTFYLPVTAVGEGARGR